VNDSVLLLLAANIYSVILKYFERFSRHQHMIACHDIWLAPQ